MPPKARIVSSAIKRKIRDEEEPDTSVKRTRSAGAPTHFVPLAGAPETISESPPTASPTTSSRLKPSGPSRARVKSIFDRVPSDSEVETIVATPSRTPPIAKTSPRKSKLVAEVVLPARNTSLKTYKKSRQSLAVASSPPESSDDELLLAPSPKKKQGSPNASAGTPNRSVVRHKSSRLLEHGVSPEKSPSKKARFVSNSPPESDKAGQMQSPRKSSHRTPALSTTSSSSSKLRRINIADDGSGSSDGDSEGPQSPTKSTRPSRKPPGGLSRTSKLATVPPNSIKKPHFSTMPTRQYIEDTEDADPTSDNEDTDALPTRLRGKSGPVKVLPKPRASLMTRASPSPSNKLPTPVSDDDIPIEHGSPIKHAAFPRTLPEELRPFFDMQRRATLQALNRPSHIRSTKTHKTLPSDATNALASLLQGTVLRGEGNSCLLLGPRKCGKTMAVETAISLLEKDSKDSGDPSAHPIVIRLSGHVHTNDKVALREIGRQLLLQNGSSALSEEQLDEEDEQGDGEDEDERLLNESDAPVTVLASQLPPPSHMSSLITTMSSLPRPTIVILDAFDLFTAHARQALLYCLLDTVQSCRAGEGRKGVAVVGVTTRVDTLNLLEKRVKSRFSHRIIRCPPPTSIDGFSELVSAPLTQSFSVKEAKAAFPTVAKHITPQRLEEWKALWGRNVEECLSSREIQRLIKEVFELSRDVNLMNGITLAALLSLHYTSPWLSPALLISASRTQRVPDAWASLSDLSFPSLSLVVASFHVQTAGHDAFTFEHLYDVYTRAARQSTSTNISLDGVLIGLPRLTRDVLIGAFQSLIDLKVFQPSGGLSASTSFQFIKYRCDVPRPDIKAAVEAKSHTQLKRWLTRPT